MNKSEVEKIIKELEKETWIEIPRGWTKKEWKIDDCEKRWVQPRSRKEADVKKVNKTLFLTMVAMEKYTMKDVEDALGIAKESGYLPKGKGPKYQFPSTAEKCNVSIGEDRILRFAKKKKNNIAGKRAFFKKPEKEVRVVKSDNVTRDKKGDTSKKSRKNGKLPPSTNVKDIEGLNAENETYSEGASKEVLVARYERNPELRQKAIDHHGTRCKVCDFDFYEKYGERGRDYIEVHHLVPLSKIKSENKISAKKDMTVLCSNCHRMIHRRKAALTPEQLKKKLVKNRAKS